LDSAEFMLVAAGRAAALPAAVSLAASESESAMGCSLGAAAALTPREARSRLITPAAAKFAAVSLALARKLGGERKGGAA